MYYYFYRAYVRLFLTIPASEDEFEVLSDLAEFETEGDASEPAGKPFSM